MFIKSMMEETVAYRKSIGVVELKPNTVTEVDENIVSYKELKDCYGDRIYMVDPELLGIDTEENNEDNDNEVNNDEVDNDNDEVNNEDTSNVTSKDTSEDEENDLTPDEAETINLEQQKQLAEAEEALNVILSSEDEVKIGFISDIQAEAAKDNCTLDATSIISELEKRYTAYMMELEAKKKAEEKEKAEANKKSKKEDKKPKAKAKNNKKKSEK